MEVTMTRQNKWSGRGTLKHDGTTLQIIVSDNTMVPNPKGFNGTALHSGMECHVSLCCAHSIVYPQCYVYYPPVSQLKHRMDIFVGSVLLYPMGGNW